MCRRPVAGGDQGQGDHAHRLLGVVRAVRQRQQRRRADLAPPEAGLLVALRHALGDLEHQSRADHGDDDRDGGRKKGREDDLPDHSVELVALADPFDAAPAEAGDRCADQPSEEGVRRTGRQSPKPGEDVPDDGAGQTGHQDQQQAVTPIGHQLGLRRPVRILDPDHSVGHGDGHLDGQERADEVEDRGKRDRGLRGQRLRGDRRGHGVCRVMEAVREIEGQRCDNNERQEYELRGHVLHGTGKPGRCGTRPIWALLRAQ